MKNWITIACFLLVSVCFSNLAYAQPPNDSCGTAIPIAVGNGSCNSILYTNVAATSVGDPTAPTCWNPSSLSHSVWFSFVASTADIEISTNFGGTLIDTQLAVYSGSCGSLTQIGCVENINTAGGLLHTNTILHGLTIGNTYYLLVDGNGNTSGTFGICAQESLPIGPPLPTQDCTGAQTLCNIGNISVPDGPGGIGSSTEAPSCFGAPGERSSNWYSFTAATSGVLAFAITPTAVIDYDFAVYNTTSSCLGTEIACNWSPTTGAAGTTGLGCAGVQCEPTINVVAGETYTILVDRFTATSSAGFSMNFAGTTATFASPNPSFTATTACIGTATQFTNTTNGNFTYNWTFGDGFTSNLENPTHTYATSGSYNVTLLVTAVPGGCQNAITQTVVVNPIPTVDAGLGGSLCGTNCITLNGSTNATGSTGPVSFTNTIDYAIPDDDPAGVSSLITVSGIAPAIINATSIASVCLNINHTFDADLDIFLQCPDGTRIRLSGDNGGIDANYTNTCFTPTATASITTGTAPFTGDFLPEQAFTLLNGCTANGNWTLFVRDDATFDTGDLLDWTITFNNNLPSYTWSPTIGMTNANTLSPTVCPTATTTYTLTANSGIGCTATDTVTVNYSPTLSPIISCGLLTPSSVEFNWLAVPGANSYIVSYQINSSPIVNAGNIGNLLTCSVNGLLPGDNVTVTITPVGSVGTCFTSASLTCTASACLAPAIPTITTTAPTCAADGFSTITNYNPANTYTFSPSGPTAAVGGSISGAVIGTSYTVTATNGGCTSAASIAFTNLVRLTTPAIPTLSTTAPTCLADGFTTITNYNPANTYAFSPSGPTAGVGGSITGAVIGTNYTVTATNGGCTSTASTTFTNLIRLTTPVIPTITTTAPTCLADGVSTITNYNPANTYTFSPSGPTAAVGGSISGAVIGTNYTVTATNGGCTSAASTAFTNLVRLTTPAIPTLSTTAPTCLTDGFSTITNYNPANTYTFSPSGPTAGVGGSITGAVIGTSFTVTATNGGCTSAASTAFTNLIRLTTPVIPTLSTTAPTCLADGFSTITNYNPANTYTFSPSGPTAGVGGSISGAVIGTSYSVTATNGSCTSAASTAFTNLVRLTTPAIPTISTTTPTCIADGFSSITNYNPANTYAFSPSGPTVGVGGNILGAVIGTSYIVTATNGGCTSAASTAFTNLVRLTTPAIPTISTTTPTCITDGASTITNYNPANTYTFLPSGPTASVGGSITGAVIGTNYTVTATNGGCTSIASTAFTNLIRLTTPVIPTLSTTAPTCITDGASTITNYNPANTYTFLPSGPTASVGGSITGAVIGTNYTVTATNGGCTSTASTAFTNLVQLTTPAIPTITTTAPTCLADGFSTITNYNPTNTYTFSPSGPTAGVGGSIIGAVIGTSYTITATNGGCTSVASTAFTNLVQLTTPAIPTISTTAPTCLADGFSTITNYNPANTYTFSPSGPTASVGGSITGAVIGTSYTITATNGGCTSVVSTAFTNLVRLTTPAIPTISTTTPTCITDGASTITNYNPANTYTFSPSGPTAGVGGSIIGAVIGTSYTVTATNGGCTSLASTAFTNLVRLTTPAIPTISTTTPTCITDGASTITNYNPANTYTFSPSGPTASVGGSITGAVIGTSYSVTATSGGCTSAASTAFTNLVRLTTPAIPTLSTTAPTCLADGFSTITNYNPTNTYTFSPSGPTAGVGGSIIGAVIGISYTVTATNGGCTSLASTAFTNLVRLTTPAIPTISTTTPTCITDGASTITNYNPANTYTFLPSGPTASVGGSISGAVIGTNYTVTATNGGCTSVASTAFTNLIQLTTPVVPTLSTTAPTCLADGFVTITNYNPAHTYTFSPIGPIAGVGGSIIGAVIGTSYTVTATNGGCTSAASTTFTNLVRLTTPIVPTITTTAPTCLADGFSTITNYNAANMYTFSPIGPTAGVGGSISGTIIGTSYTVTATNRGCTSSASTAFTNLIQLTTPTIPTIVTTAPTCAADGFSTITNYNAAHTYTFLPSGPTAGVGGSISGMVIGTNYTLTATNGGCTSAASTAFTNLIRLTTPAIPTLSTTAPTCLADGFTTITNYNPAHTYTFSPSGPTAGVGGSISGAVIGISYTVTATNGGCTSAASTAFTNLIRLTTPVIPTMATTAPTCLADGFSTITNYNPANTYTFSPTGPTVGVGGNILGAVIGTNYTVTATNGGCTSAASTAFTNIVQLTTPAIPTISTTTPTCITDGASTITNYNPANTYTFLPSGPTAGVGGSIIGAVIGTSYTVTATNGGCTSVASTAFTNLVRLTTPAIPTISTTTPTCITDGASTITNYNPANTYTFLPSGPTASVGGSISGAVIGTNYTVTATNGGCTSTASTAFTNLIRLTTPAIPTISTTTPTCITDGASTITNYNPANTYTFLPSGPTAGVGGSISGAVIGTNYTVTATNGGCTSANSLSFVNAPLLFNINSATPQPLLFCDDNNDGFGTFNLTQVIPSITLGNPYLVSFHETPTDAAIGGTAIPNAGSYGNINPNVQTIYIRVASNLYSCFTVIPLQLIVNPSPIATEPNDYSLCDTNGDTIENFNLTSVELEVLGSITPATHTISYYTSLGDAQSETAVITNVTSFPSSGQTLWIRVENNATGCFDIVTLALIVNPIPLATQPNYPPYSLCDATMPLGFEEFDLGSKINGILLGQNGMNVTFHFNQTDATADLNPLPLLYTNIAPFVQTLWIRIENAATGCFTLSTIDIRVEPLPSPIPPTQAYSICDTNQDGFSTFNLNSLTNAMLQGANYTISYHETYDDAQLGNNPLISPYDNIIPFTQFLYALAVDPINGCQTIIPIELEVKPQPITPFNIPDITLCDEDSNTQDLTTSFDLTLNEALVLGIQPSAASNYNVTYHISLTDANTDNAPIVQPTNYIGTHLEIIWVRIEDIVTGCFSIGSFELRINAPLLLSTPTPLNVCDADTIPNNQFTVFDLTVKNNEITGGQANMQVIYFPDYPVTPSSIPISNPSAYTNYIPAVQTLGVMVTTPDGCKSYTSMDIRVLPIPVPNSTAITPLPPQCDVNNTGDMLEIFDVTANATTIINGDPRLTLHYYPTYNDALADTAEILTPTTALVGQNVWIRVENNSVDYLGNNCFVLVEQPITVYPLPSIVQPMSFQVCDDDTDGSVMIDLTTTNISLLASGQSVNDFSITYYTSALNAQLGTNPITNPTQFINLTNPQIIYVRIVNTNTGCINYNGQFTLFINPQPTVTIPSTYGTCDTDGTNDGYFTLDLSSYVSGIIGSQTNVSVTFYDSQSDALTGNNPIINLINYQAYTHALWIRVNDLTTGCYKLASFNIIVELLAEPNITAPSDIICVEYGTNILLSGLTLDSGITNPNYMLEWFEASYPTTVLGTGFTYTINTLAPGNYTVVATSTSPLACPSNSSNVYTVTQSGPPQFASPPFNVSNYFDENQTVTVNAVGFGVYEYSLDDGPFQSSPIFEHVSVGSHTITVRDATGRTSCGQLSLSGIQTIDYPHYFTPNGDGFNDTWNVRGLNQANARLYIFDRYGKLLKQISVNGDGWDGTLNGHPLPSTDYWFTIEYLEQSQWKEFRAHFTLKR